MLLKTDRRGKHRKNAGEKRHAQGHGLVHLSDLRAGETGRIISFQGGKNFREKMSGMGLFQGIEIEVLQTDGDEGMMLICVCGARLMLCRRMAGKIHLERID